MRLSIGMGLYDRLRAAAVAAGSTLLDGLVSYWGLDEVSGTRYDLVGDNDLTDNNTVGYLPRGPLGTVAKTVAANSEVLTSIGEIEDQPAALTQSIWVKLDPSTPDGYQSVTIHGNYMNLGGYASGGKIVDAWVGGYTEGGGGAYMSIGSNWGGINADGAGWLMLTGVSEADRLTFYINGKTYAGWSTAVAGVARWTRYGGGGGLVRTLGSSWGSQFFNGKISRHGIWGRALSASEIEELYANGSGLDYSDLPTALKTDLFNWYELDEVSGVRYDSHGSNDLTDNNTVGSVNTGPLGTVANFVAANNETLSIADNAQTVWGEDGNGATVSMWLKTSGNFAGYPFLFGRGTGIATSHQLLLYGINGSTAAVLRVSDSGGATYSDTAYFSAGAGEWVHILAWFNQSDKKGYVSANGSAPISTSALTTSSLWASSDPLVIGGSGTSDPFNGTIASVGVWNRMLDETERTALAASGLGKRYEDLTTDEKVGLVSYWNLDEQSGVRYDSHGSNDLTDNNTVGSVINAGDAMDGGAASFVAANSETLSQTGVVSPVASDMSLSCWINLGANPVDDMSAYDFSEDYVSGPWLFYNSTYGLVAYVNYGEGGGQIAAPPIPASTWMHVLWTWEVATRTSSWYYNGVQKIQVQTASAYPLSGSGGPLVLGRSKGYGRFWNGLIDEVAIWDRVLTADERAELFALGRGSYYDFA